MRSFAPKFIAGATFSRAASTSSANVAVPATLVPTGSAYQLRIYNSGTDAAFINVGTTSAVTAAVTDYPVPGGAVEVITIENPSNAQVSHIAAITASGTPTLYFTIGQGI